jgi:hypothetical protein
LTFRGWVPTNRLAPFFPPPAAVTPLSVTNQLGQVVAQLASITAMCQGGRPKISETKVFVGAQPQVPPPSTLFQLPRPSPCVARPSLPRIALLPSPPPQPAQPLRKIRKTKNQKKRDAELAAAQLLKSSCFFFSCQQHKLFGFSCCGPS